jgi:hypothetical protein
LSIDCCCCCCTTTVVANDAFFFYFPASYNWVVRQPIPYKEFNPSWKCIRFASKYILAGLLNFRLLSTVDLLLSTIEENETTDHGSVVVLLLQHQQQGYYSIGETIN